MSTIIETGIDYKNLDNTKYMRSYIMRLNDDIRYMLTNIDPEDNFDSESLSNWIEYGETANGIQKTIDQLKLSMITASGRVSAAITQRADSIELCVKKKDVTSAINNQLLIGTDAIRINTNRLEVDSDNFKLKDNDLTISGEIISNEGNFGGFQIQSDSEGPYLDAGSDGEIRGGTLFGSIGKFKIFSCAGTEENRSTMTLIDANVNLKNCRITSTGMKYDGDFYVVGDLDAARYVESTEEYTDRKQIFVKDTITTHQNIWVERYAGTSNSGLVQCYTVFSYIAGGEYSDRDLKYDVTDIDGSTAIRMIVDLKPVHYELKEDGSEALGFIAQDIFRLQSEYGDYGMLGMNEDGMYTLSYSRFIPVLAAAVKEIDRELHGSD